MNATAPPAAGNSCACAATAAAGFVPSCAGHFVATYHYIRERNSDGVTGITPGQFAAQVRAIARRYRIVGADEFAARHAREPGLALITFDDALRDQQRAADILDDLGVPGVFFAPMRPYGPEADGWCPQHLLHALAERLGWAEFAFRVEPYIRHLAIDPGEVARLYHYEAPHKRRAKYALAFALPAATTRQILSELNAPLGLRAADWYLPAEQLGALERAGHCIGGHGYEHVPYPTLSAAEQAADMRRAVEVLARLVGPRARPIAYPFGGADETTHRLARAAGYALGFTTRNRVDAKFVLDELAARHAGAAADPAGEPPRSST